MQRRYFFPVILFILAYEWLVSGLDKLISMDFVSGLSHQLQAAASTGKEFPFYASLLRIVVLPHSAVFAWLVIGLEVSLGTAFVVLGVLVVTRHSQRSVRMTGIVTGFVAALVTLNFFFYQGGSILLSVSHPFEPGVSLDIFMLCTQLAVAGRFWTPHRRAHGRVEMRVVSGGRGRRMA